MKVYGKFNLMCAALFAFLALMLIPSINGLNKAIAASTDISSVPLFTSNSAANVVKPNLMVILDDSGSMDWDYMPDNAGDFSMRYGFPSSQCNGVYYNPNVVYHPPITSTGVIYPDATFTSALKNGYDNGSGNTNLSSSFKSESADTAQPAYYYTYSGTQTTEKLKDYYTAFGTFYKECNSPIGNTIAHDDVHPVNTLFTKVLVGSTSGPGTKDINNDGVINSSDKDERQNFANWYSYYRTRMLMMKTSTGLAFDALDDQFRVGFMSINNNNGSDFLNITDFDATHKGNWYDKLYSSTANNATPLRAALSQAGLLYAGKVATINGVATTDPVQYACQRNYTILSTDGFWTTGGGKKLNGTTAMGNEDALLPRPFFDGSIVTFQKSTSQLTKLQTRYTSTAQHVTQRDFQIQKKTTQLQKKDTDSNVLKRTRQFQKRQETLQKFQATRQIKQAILQRWQAVRQEQQDVLQKFQAQRQIKQDVLQKFQTQRQQRIVTYSKVTTQRQKQTIPFSICNSEGFNCLSVNQDCRNGTGLTLTRPNCVTGTISPWANSTCTTADGNPVTFCRDLSPTTSTTYGLGSCTAGTDASGLTTACTISDSGWVDVSSCTANASQGKTCQDKPSSTTLVGDDSSCTANAANGVSCAWQVDTTWSNVATCTANATQHTFCQSLTATLVGNDSSCVANANAGVSCAWLTDTTWSDVASCTVSTNHRCQDKPSSNAYVADDSSCVANVATGVSCIWQPDPTWSDVASCTDNAALGISCQSVSPTLVGNDSSCVANVAAGVSCAYLSGSGTWVNASLTNTDKCTANAAVGIYCQTLSDTGSVSVATCSASDPVGGPTVTCPTPPTPVWVNTGTCNAGTVGTITTTCQTTNPAWANASSCADTPMDGAGANVECQTTDSGWYGVASCTVQSTPVSGKTIDCNTVIDASVDLVTCGCTAAAGSSCNATATASTTPAWTGYLCENKIVSPKVGVAACANDSATAANSFVRTTCSTETTGPTTVNVCSNIAADSSNSYIQTTCSVPSVSGGTTDTLADTAAYYYNTQLRTTALGNCGGPFYDAAIPATDRCALNLVEGTADDPATSQHMTTYTVGLGARGRMVASPTYKSDGNSDYGYISVDTIKGPTTCVWPDDAVNFVGGQCNWPYPSVSAVENIDDLWHAAVNGHGVYFNATDPEKLKTGLGDLLTDIINTTLAGTSASSAAASPKISISNNKLYSSYFKSGEWSGELISQTVDINTGAVPNYDPANPDPDSYEWSAQTLLDAKDYTTRKIYTAGTASNAGTNGLIDFNWSNIVAAGLAGHFNAPSISTSPPEYPKILTGLTQFCITGSSCLTAAAQTNFTVATNGAGGEGLVNFLRGDRSGEEGVLTDPAKYYRHRTHVLGDIVTSESQYVATSNQLLDEALNPGYATFKSTNVSRAPTIYTAANDGMLHAFDAATGEEKWAYIPSNVLPRLFTLADKKYTNKHQYFVEGTPKVSDVYINSQWRTILVGGLSGGGTGYYALDVTDPDTPKRLWEFSDDDMGYSFGNPVITKQSDGNWVVLLTSGYDNCPKTATDINCAKNGVGDGKGHLYVLDAETGALVSSPSSNILTSEGSSTDPSGLAKIVGFAPVDNFTNKAYAGDLKGNLWRFTITPGGYAKQLLASFKDAAGNAQPITTKPVVTTVSGDTVVYVGTGRYLGISDLGNSAQQSFYAVKDTGQTTSYGNPRLAAAGFIKQQAVTGTCPAAPANDPDTTVDESKQYLDICVAGESVRSVTSSTTDTLATRNGWILDFPVGAKELSFTDPTIYSGTLLFSTSRAIAGVTVVCGAATPGNAVSFGYKVDYLTGGAVYGQFGIMANQLGIGLATAPRLFQTAPGEVKTQTNLSTGQKVYGKPPPNPVVNPTKRLSWTEGE